MKRWADASWTAAKRKSQGNQWMLVGAAESRTAAQMMSNPLIFTVSLDFPRFGVVGSWRRRKR